MRLSLQIFRAKKSFLSESAIRFEDQFNGLSQVLPSLFESGALSVRTRQFFDEPDLALGHLLEHGGELHKRSP